MSGAEHKDPAELQASVQSVCARAEPEIGVVRLEAAGEKRENAVKILAAAVCALALSSAAAMAETAPTPAAAAAPQSAGLCVLLDEKGQVIDARIAQTSGDPSLDENAVALARQLQWSPPYPQPGWLGVRITLSPSGPGPSRPGAMPHCSAASDAAVANSI